jgi:hypothetical protein
VFSCSYEVTNSQGLRASATIVVSVLEPSTTNAAPVVADEDVTVEINQDPITIDVLSNDTDPDGLQSSLRVLSSTRPALGSATRTGGLITFDAGPAVGVAVIT